MTKKTIKKNEWPLAEEDDFYLDILNNWKKMSKDELIEELKDYVEISEANDDYGLWQGLANDLKIARLRVKVAIAEVKNAENRLLEHLEYMNKPTDRYDNYWYPEEDN